GSSGRERTERDLGPGEGSAAARLSVPARIVRCGHRPLRLLADRRELDVDDFARRAERRAQVRVVAERLVLRKPGAAQRCARQRLDGSILVPHLDVAPNQQRPVADRRDARWLGRLLLEPAVEAAVLERTAWAALDDARELIGVRGVGHDPRTAT